MWCVIRIELLSIRAILILVSINPDVARSYSVVFKHIQFDLSFKLYKDRIANYNHNIKSSQLCDGLSIYKL